MKNPETNNWQNANILNGGNDDILPYWDSKSVFPFVRRATNVHHLLKLFCGKSLWLIFFCGFFLFCFVFLASPSWPILLRHLPHLVCFICFIFKIIFLQLDTARHSFYQSIYLLYLAYLVGWKAFTELS